jgi:uncharacterized 2Fe-2S/4Fe-4S cluster protein (DUF4445 family)
MAYTIEFEPAGIRLLCEEPLLVAEAAQRAGIALRAECGARAGCGQCRVRIDGDGLSPSTQAERAHLGDDQLAEGWRLACRSVITADAVVYVPDTSLREAQVVQLDGLVASFDPQPAVRLLPVTIPRPSLTDQAADLQRLASALRRHHGAETVWATLPVLQALGPALREGVWQVAAALRSGELVAVFPGPAPRPIGLAVDLGTTKLACFLVDLETGRTLAAKGVMSPQIARGEDVMSRLERVLVDGANAARLQADVVDAINAVAADLCASLGQTAGQLLDVCLVGNTAMHHLLLKLPVRPLALSPFVAALSSPLDLPSSQIGLLAAPGARLHLPPPVAGFVGSDHVAFLLATGFGEDGRTRLAIDIGTNTEIALQARGRILCCSTASGPAFEGAHIRCGMRAALGAIERVRIAGDGTVETGVIGEGEPVGICGSGILDALAEMRRAEILNHRGRIVKGMPGVRREGDGAPVFVVARGRNGRRDVTIDQHDVNEVLLVKGAIRAGIEILMERLQVRPEELDQIVIAGAFGCHLDPAQAMRIRLLPHLSLDKVEAVGNAAGAGARLMLASTHARSRAAELARRLEHVELARHPTFHRQLALAMRLSP